MLKSMTSYAKINKNFGNKNIEIEFLSLNSKTNDLYIKNPPEYNVRLLEIKRIFSPLFFQGKVNINIRKTENLENIQVVDESKFISYFNSLKTISDKLKLDNTDSELFRLSFINYQNNNIIEETNENEWKILFEGLQECYEIFDKYRIYEGEILYKLFNEYIQNIDDLLIQVEDFEQNRVEKLKEKLFQKLKELNIDDLNLNRYEQELIYYIEKIDITEEKVRLKSNLDLFLHTIENEDNCGKKLNFISQEIGREINTLGSKSYDENIQKIVIKMKDFHEKIKEQLGNTL